MPEGAVPHLDVAGQVAEQVHAIHESLLIRRTPAVVKTHGRRRLNSTAVEAVEGPLARKGFALGSRGMRVRVSGGRYAQPGLPARRSKRGQMAAGDAAGGLPAVRADGFGRQPMATGVPL